MQLFRRLFPDRSTDRRRIAPLYRAIVDHARAPHWYMEGGVPDTVDGRFDAVAAMLSLVLIRLEGDEAARGPSTHLAEAFVDDMDGQLREIGVGDVMVGKHVGRMMSALGGRLAAYRGGLANGGDLDAALRRNLYRGGEPPAGAVAHVAGVLRRWHAALAAVPTAAILAGDLPA